MAHLTTSQSDSLLRLAALIRHDYEIAKALSQNSDVYRFPENLRAYAQQVKGLVGDWEATEAAQTYDPAAKATMQVWILRAEAIFPVKLAMDEAQKIFASQPMEADETPFITCEVRRFWMELEGASDLLDVRLLAIKYDLTLNTQ
jgi:hypothetical protein